MSALADVAAAIADRTRARMLEELLAGPPLPAGALAVRVGVAPSTVSGHLARLESAGLVTITAVGRRREAQLAGPHVAEALEALRRLAGDDPRPIGLREVNGRAALREARSCYDHLAGRAGVALADDLVARGALTDQFTVPDGAAGYYREAFGIDIGALPGRRPLVRRLHRLDRAPPARRRRPRRRAARSMLERGWLARRPDGRALNVTPRASVRAWAGAVTAAIRGAWATGPLVVREAGGALPLGGSRESIAPVDDAAVACVARGARSRGQGRPSRDLVPSASARPHGRDLQAARSAPVEADREHAGASDRDAGVEPAGEPARRVVTRAATRQRRPAR